MSKYSIILPVRNGGNYIKDCIASILNQSYQEFNLHILENRSTDGTTEWLRSLTDPRIILIEAESPLSIEENWKRILKIKKNEFITLIGHDDILYKDYLYIMDNLIQKYPDVGLYQTHFDFINSKGDIIRPCKPMSEKMNGVEFLRNLLLNNIDVMGTGFMMRSADYERVGGLPAYPNLLFADFELLLELTKDNGFVASQEKMFAFRIHLSTTTTSSNEKIQMGFERFILYLKNLQNKNEDFNQAIKQHANVLIHGYCKGLSHRLLRSSLKQRDFIKVKDFILKCRQYSKTLSVEQTYEPLEDYSIKLAFLIDSNPVTRALFLAFKKLYSKPILK